MKKLISIDWVIIAMLDTEAKIFETSSSQIIRVAILEYLCRSNQSRFPFFFQNEKLIADFNSTVRNVYYSCHEISSSANIPNFFQSEGTKLYEELYCRLLDLLREERSTLNHS